MPVNDEVSAWGFGFSTKLNSDHDQQKIECVSNYRDIKSTVKLTFVLQQKLNGKLKCNDIFRKACSSTKALRNKNFLGHLETPKQSCT